MEMPVADIYCPGKSKRIYNEQVVMLRLFDREFVGTYVSDLFIAFGGTLIPLSCQQEPIAIMGQETGLNTIHVKPSRHTQAGGPNSTDLRRCDAGR